MTASVHLPRRRGRPRARSLCATSTPRPTRRRSRQTAHRALRGGDLVAAVVNASPLPPPWRRYPIRAVCGQDIICTAGNCSLQTTRQAWPRFCSLLARIQANQTCRHPTLKIAFVPDEEIGHGAELLDLERFGAKWCYTVDGEALGDSNYECFSACQLRVFIHGVMVHPGSAKNVMVNASRLPASLTAGCPRTSVLNILRPRSFYHPISIEGSASEVKLPTSCVTLIRQALSAVSRRCATIAAFMNARYGEGTVEVRIKQQYSATWPSSSRASSSSLTTALEANAKWASSQHRGSTSAPMARSLPSVAFRVPISRRVATMPFHSRVHSGEQS